eukprot:TRINITY_DN12956_c0_g4_i1.p2 TRINITY_DN12956_c0_g4~~TRINITY_DN12956_c0_g4_i1.p2  ORF type:complete len:213 (+),score=80.38 TRINITY_DN12956_c0_g4_i1:761-1399(+)
MLIEYLKVLYKGLKQSFVSYSEHIILYYLYKRPGINGMFSTKHFIELCGISDRNVWKRSAASTATEVKSAGVGSDVEELVVKTISDNTMIEAAKCSNLQAGGLNLLELPFIDEDSCNINWSEQEKDAIESIRNSISRGESSLLESEEANSLCTNNLVEIEEYFGKGTESKPKETDLSQIQVEEITIIDESKKNKDTFIKEIGVILNEINHKS